MGVAVEEFLIEINGYNANKYRKKGYVINEVPCSIKVKVDDVNSSHEIFIPMKCDFCDRDFKISTKKYKDKKKQGIKEFYCGACKTERLHKRTFEKYGVTSGSKLPDFKEKVRKKSLEKYGTEHYTQNLEVRQKWKKSMLENQGTTSFAKYVPRDSKNVICSNNQRHIAELLNGEINKKFHGFFLDVFYEDWLDIEYNGGGHDLCVKLGKISKEEFDKKERQRNGVIRHNGIKQLIIIHNNKKLPEDEKLKPLLEKLIELLRNSEYKAITLDLDNNDKITLI